MSWTEMLTSEWDRQDERARAGRCPVCGNGILEVVRLVASRALANCPRCHTRNVKIAAAPAHVRETKDPGLAA